jgi:hypothetical protein
VPASDPIDAFHDAFFRVCEWIFRARDRLAALRDRLPKPGDLAASTAVAYVAVGILAAILVDDLIAPTHAVSPSKPVPAARSAWIEVTRNQSAFALESPALEGLHARYVFHRHRTGGGRKDSLIWGNVADAGPYVRVVLYRPGAEAVDSDPLEAAVAVASESAIEAELAGPTGELVTKFGLLPLIDMTVKEGERRRACLAAAGHWNEPRLGIVAWWCNAGPELVARGQFACMLDRLNLMSAGGDDRLAQFFAKAELKRGSCGASTAFINPTPKRPDHWLDAKAAPKLRGRIAGR